MRARHIKISSALLTVALFFFTQSAAFAQEPVETPQGTSADSETVLEPAAPATPVVPAAAADVPPAAPVQVETGEPAGAASPDASAELSVETPVKQLPNSKALEESSLNKGDQGGGHDEFKRPLLFAPEDNGMQPENPQIKWDMDASGLKINLGGLKLSSDNFNVKIDQTRRPLAPDDIRNSSKGSDIVINMSFSWPALLSTSGTVSIETENKVVAWSKPVTEDMRAEWRKKLLRYKNTFLKAHAGMLWGITDLNPKAIKRFRGGTPFRVCLSKTNSEIEKLRACSGLYSFQEVGHGRQVAPFKKAAPPLVALGGKPIGPHGLVNLPLGKEVDLRVDFADSSFVELSSQPAALHLVDVVQSKDGHEIILTGRLAQPLGKKKILSRAETGFWAASGIDVDTIWQIALPIETPTLRVLGAFNLPFTFLFRAEKLPTENDRIFIREAASTGTYSSHPLLFGYSTRAGPISSEENSAKKTDDHHFEWSFWAPHTGQQNRARLSILGSDESTNTWVVHHELYRGFPLEASARLAGILDTSAQLVILGEVAANAWAESLGFTQNDLISRQRWGATVRYFRGLTPFKSKTGISVSEFNALNGDLKYNLRQGIWNRDQLFGIMGSVESINVGGSKANLGGGGFYWARTMPRFFADLFDKFPLLDYSKYVDVELVFYPLAISQDVTPGFSFNLNFHGKLFWTKRIYGEAGFGLRNYDYKDKVKNTSLGASYGNVGIGMIF